MNLKLQLISDFNIEVLGRYLTNSKSPPVCSVDLAPFNQVFQALSQPGDSEDGDAIGIVWARPEAVLPGFQAALDFETVELSQLGSQVDAFVDRVRAYASGRRHVLVQRWSLPLAHRGYGVLNWKPGLGLENLLARLNLRLADGFDAADSVFVVDLLQRSLRAGARPTSPKLWFAAKIPYPNRVFELAAAEIKEMLLGLMGRARRLVVVDLDDTLWGGIVGETGWQELRLGGHDHVGEAFVAFQRALKALTHRGIQLAVVSKNDERVALEAIDDHPDMVLRRSDLAGWRINWNDKAGNILELVDELRLGLESAVFIDDNPAERGRVREALPEVLVPEWPKDPTAYVETLLSMGCFDSVSMSVEDRQRTAMYVAEREREGSRAAVSSFDDWLQTLDIRVAAEPVSSANLPRLAQLFNKTNQMNMSTRRLTAAEIQRWVEAPERFLNVIRVVDRFGDSGLTGVVSIELEGDTAILRDFILSCRVMGRRIEEALLHLGVCAARERGATEVVAQYLPTDRNGPCLRALRGTGLTEPETHRFTWDCSEPYPLPSCISLIREPASPQET